MLTDGGLTVQGFSLVEVMITLTLNVIITLGLIQVYNDSKNNYQFQDAMARLQERGQTAIYFFQQELRSAGYLGCAKLTRDFPIINHTEFIFSENSIIRGYSATQAISELGLPTQGHGAYVSGTDVLVMRKMSETTANLVSMSQTQVIVSAKPQFKEQQTLFITDCTKADIFTVQQVSTTKNSQWISTEPIQTYEKNAQVGQALSQVYYLGDTGRKNKQNQTILALYSRDDSGEKAELVEGIEDMQVFYGVDTNGNGSVSTYRTAAEISDWSRVLSVHVILLVNSIEEIGVDLKPYVFQEKQFSDRKLRQTWDTYIALRTRLN